MTAPSATLISTSTELKAFLSIIKPGTQVYLDLEGRDLGRHGTLTLATILILPQKVARVVDVMTLGAATFTIESQDGTSLKTLLESADVPKCVWDVRNDADALWTHFQVKLAGIVDVQLLETASRPAWMNKTRISGLATAIRSELNLGFMDQERWERTKRDIKGRMPQNIFSSRPLAPNTLQYCINDVIHLPALQKRYMQRITFEWLVKSREESRRRVVEACSPEYQPQSPDKTLSPWKETRSATRTLEAAVEELWDDDYDVEVEEYDSFVDDDPKRSADVDDFDGVFDDCWTKY